VKNAIEPFAGSAEQLVECLTMFPGGTFTILPGERTVIQNTAGTRLVWVLGKDGWMPELPTDTA
jgi:hypothetical protein